MDLFLEPDVQFAKVAAETMLPEDPNQWTNELMQELFRQVPYVADFEPHITMDRVDAERGFGFGHVEVQNKTEIQHGADPAAMASAGIKSARIPVVIKDRKLQPLDLLVTGDSKILPLTESRMRQTLFRPQAFDITGRGPGDMSMIGQLYPPYRQNYGFGGGGATMSVGMGKEGALKTAFLGWGKSKAESTAPEHLAKYESSKFSPTAEHFKKGLGLNGSDAQDFVDGWSTMRTKLSPSDLRSFHEAFHKAENTGKSKEGSADAVEAWARYDRMRKTGSVLSSILPTIRASDYTAFFDKLAGDPGLQAQYVANGGATGESLKKLAGYTPGDTRKLAGAVLRHIKPSVAQLRKEAEGYSLKTASNACWMPEVQELDRGQAVRLLGPKVVLAADTAGSATMALGEGAGKPEGAEEDKPELVSQFGIYKVQDEAGRHLIGYVFTNLIDIDGSPLPIAMFTNGSQMAVQGEIAGVRVGDGASLFEGHPRGKGAFYRLLPNGKAAATVPMNVKATVAAPEQGGVIMHAETFDGRQVQVIVQPNLESIVPSPDGDHLLIPDSFSWLPLDQAEDTALVSSPDGFNKEGEARRKLATVQVRCGGTDSFSLSGFPVDKLASAERDFLSMDDTLFVLGALGANMKLAEAGLGEAAAFSRPVDIRIGRYIKTAEDQMIASANAAREVLAASPDLRCDLFKEAAVIPDPTAVDTVLSLGFLNPENLGVFISYLPVLDEAQGRMCELLLAARLGLREVPVSALEKAIRSTEETLEGLKVLAFQRN